MGISTTKAEAVDAGSTRGAFWKSRPFSQARRYFQIGVEWFNVGMEFIEQKVWWDDAVLKSE